MKNFIIRISLSLFTLALWVGCAEEDYDFGPITAPSNIEVETQVVGQTEAMPDGDGSGVINFSVSADNAMTYKFIYGDGFEEVSYDGTTSHPFTKNGVNDYNVTIIASGTGGASSSITETVTVFSDFKDPLAKQLLTGGDTKTWYIAAAQPGHLGVGPAAGAGFDAPGHYAAAPFEKAGSELSSCFYTDEMTFNLTEGGEILYDYDNNGQTFFNGAYVSAFGGGGSEDACLPYEPSGTMAVSLSPSTSGLTGDQTTGTVLNIADGGFLGYYIGASSYEILAISENSMYVRAIMGNDPALAWYLKLTTTVPGEEQPPVGEFDTEYTDLVWEQDFLSDLDPAVWNFEIGNNNGWGNNELQYYTEDNAVVENGNLVITARAEDINGFDYSSSRITTQDKFEFKYGRVEVRAKMPEGAGTWPAVWMLGHDIAEVGWPESGEIDIVEHVGNNPNTIHGTLHYPGRSGGNADGDTTVIENASSEFHTYAVEWSPERIVFLVDGEVFHTYANTSDSVFNKEFFLILNVAIGGNLGGEVDPAFDESSLIVDYVRVYQ